MGHGELVHLAVPAGRVLQPVLPVPHQDLGGRDVSHAASLTGNPDSFSPHSYS